MAHRPQLDRGRRGGSRRAAAGIATLGTIGALALGLAVLGPGGRPSPSSAAVERSAHATSRAEPSASGGASSASSDAAPSSVPSPTPSAETAAGPFPNGLLIADRGNGRILIVDDRGRILWSFPHAGALPPGQAFSADDAFLTADRRTIVANDEFHQTIDKIDIATGRLIWQFGRYDRIGSARGMLHTPDDAYPLANGDIVVADIENCRVLEIAADKSIVRQWGTTGDCRDAPPHALARPNGDTPLPDGGLLITEITGSRVVRLAADGHVVFDIHVPVAYPSDAQLDSHGDVVVADFSSAGQVVAVDPKSGAVVWRWAYRSGARRLDHPSLATPLPDGLVSVNDDFRHRLVVIDPRTGRIVWQFGRTDRPGRTSTTLNTPDGHQPIGGPVPGIAATAV
jgi:outer membrane protein assembly factor BamB